MGICPSVTKRYEGVGGGSTSALRNVFFFKLGLPSCPRVRRGFQNNLVSISNIMFQCIMLTTKTCSHITNYP